MKPTCAFAFVLLCCAAVSHAAEPIVLAEGGQAKAVIVHNGHTEPAPGLPENLLRQKQIAAPVDNLHEYLKHITGADFPRVKTLAEAGGKPAIVLELVAKLPGASDSPRGAQAYRITTSGNRLTLSAATPLALHYAVSGLLEDHLGCRFYTFVAKGMHYGGRGHEVVPKQAKLLMPRIDDFQEPAFANRGFIFWMGSYPWILQNRGHGMPSSEPSGSVAAGHNMYGVLPPNDVKDGDGKVTVEGWFAKHPEFYPMNAAGVRETTWTYGICGTNAKLPAALAQGLERDVKWRIKQAGGGEPDWSMPFSAAQGDGFSGCHCPDCRKLVKAEQSESAPLVLALNRALDILGKTYPKAQVITFAYFDTLDAPKTLIPHKNLWINVVSSAHSQNAAGDQIGPIANNPANRDYAKALIAWPKIAPGRVTVWHWDTYRAEWPSIFYLAENTRFMHEAGIYAINPQYCGGPWVSLLAWVQCKLVWNPKLDGDKLIRQYVDDNYGTEAGAHVWRYLKLAQKGYADSLWVPSAVRWSGWSPLLRAKLFPTTLLGQMNEAMDQAMAAATKAGNPAHLANLIGARGQSLDVINVDAANSSGKPWGAVRYDGDGKRWFVTGANALVPGCVMRAKKGIVQDGGGESGILRTISGYVASNGGPLVELSGAAMNAAVCPDLKGQVVSAVDKASGKELLAVQGANSGYADVFNRISAQIWLPIDQATSVAQRANDDWSEVWSRFANPNPSSLETHLVLSQPHYGFDDTRSLRRTVSVTDAGLRIERSYAGALDVPNVFTTRWLLAMPDSKRAKVSVKGGGLDQLLDLQYAVPGGIKGVKAGEKLKGADWMDERIDNVIAVSDAEAVKLALKSEVAGDVVIQLDRGDGVVAVLTTAVAGWQGLELKPVVEGKHLEITLIGAEQKAAPAVLPVQILSARTAPVVKAAGGAAPVEVKPVAAKVKITGATTGINEHDGAELIWIPAGAFLRGSPDGTGGADERPQRTITLDGYWIYKTPVTLAQYQKFVNAAGITFDQTWGQGMHAEPKGDPGSYAVLVNWYEGETYAKAMGAALPSEAQWEKAARGTDGRAYPWGNQWDPTKCVSMEATIYAFNTGFRPVGSHPAGASPYGVHDMAGGVWEWVADWYDGESYANAPAANPTGPESGVHKVLRGGTALYDERFSRSAARFINPPHVRDWTPTGFRCVVKAPGPP